GQNMIVNQAAEPPALPLPGTAASVAVGQTYVVQPGDTVYSLSRRLCAPIGEVMSANGIGGDFAISIGQTLVLPTSRC
ncbi:MAG: LysM domain-containing protein, partial [Litorimonas sp.]